MIFVRVALTNVGNKHFPDARGAGLHRVCCGVPSIEIADDGNRPGVGGPHSKLRSSLSAAFRKVGTKPFVGSMKRAFCQQIAIEFTQDRRHSALSVLERLGLVSQVGRSKSNYR